jgi:hypothetical protein
MKDNSVFVHSKFEEKKQEDPQSTNTLIKDIKQNKIYIFNLI